MKLDASQMVRDLLYIPDRGLSQRKARYSLQRELDPTQPPGRILLSKPGPICGQVGLNPIFHVQFSGSAVFFGILGKKSLALSNILFLVGRKFLSKLVNILVGLGILDVSGQVHWVGLPIIRYIHVKYWSRVGFFGSYHHSFPTTCYFLIFNRNIFLFLTCHE